jgi:hypothetical protein
MAVKLDKRMKEAPRVQEVLTRHGCIITLRVGLHETGGVCADSGLILLGLCGSKREVARLRADLQRVTGVTAKTLAV